MGLPTSVATTLITTHAMLMEQQMAMDLELVLETGLALLLSRV